MDGSQQTRASVVRATSNRKPSKIFDSLIFLSNSIHSIGFAKDKMKLSLHLIAASFLGRALAFAPVHHAVRKVSTTLSMAADEEGPVLNKYSR